MVCVGVTVAEPAVACAPVQPPEAVQEEAFVEDQERVEELPADSEVGEAERVTVGAGVAWDCVVALAADDWTEVFPAVS